MTLSEIALMRLESQQISVSKFNTAKELVGWMGAIQAQDYSMSKWAIGCRLPHADERTIEAALDNGEILRTHVLRPTWHIVLAQDIYWMLDLTASRIKAAMRSQHKELELTPTLLTQSNTLLENSLKGGRHLNREELLKEFQKSNIATHENRLSHLLAWAELDGLICSGALKNNKNSYALLEERVQKPPVLLREEALSKLARKYFSSHCPATLKDFTWWSGLTVTEAAKALDFVKRDLVVERIGMETYWLPSSFANGNEGKNAVYLLPAFDEFIISYKDRSASIHMESQRKAISINGLFRPVVVINGKVTALWKRIVKNDKVIIEVEFFKPHSIASGKRLKNGAELFGRFLNKAAVLEYING